MPSQPHPVRTAGYCLVRKRFPRRQVRDAESSPTSSKKKSSSKKKKRKASEFTSAVEQPIQSQEDIPPK